VNIGTLMHALFAFLAVGVFINIMARPGSFVQLLSGTFGSLTDVSKNIAAIR
jgi:hypothetical protein